MGNESSQLKVHINGALTVGCSRTEIIEVIMQMAVYARIHSETRSHLLVVPIVEIRQHFFTEILNKLYFIWTSAVRI